MKQLKSVACWILLLIVCGPVQNVQFKRQDEDTKELRLLLIGKTGSGKSASGNTILGRKDAFKEGISAGPVTVHCQKEQVTRYGRSIVVVDSPGLSDISHTVIREKMKACVKMSVPGPHAFLLVISLKARFEEEDKRAIEWLKTNFGPNFSLYTILLFTHGDMLQGKTVEKFVSESTDLRTLYNNCGGRYVTMTNGPGSDPKQVQKLLQKVGELVTLNRGTHYTMHMYEKAQNFINAEEEDKTEEEEQDENRRTMCNAAYVAALAALSVGVFVPSSVAIGMAGLIASTAGYECFAHDFFGFDHNWGRGK